MLTQIDQVLFRLGKPGRFQVLVIFLLCCVQLQTSFNKYLLDFYIDSPPPHRCKATSNATVGESELRPLVEEKGKKRYSSCEMYVDPTNHKLGTKNCINGWEYFTTEIEWTIIPEWDLVCEWEYLVTLLPYLSCGGAMIGCLLFGMLADRFGRQRVLVTLLILYTGSSVSLYFLSQFVLFSTIIGLEGFFITGVQCISYVLLMETVPTPYHLRLAVLVGSFWAAGTLALTLVAYLIQHWRYIQLAISVPGVVSVTYFWLLPLSIPWLITNGRTLSAENQIERLGHFNGVTLCPSFRLQIQNAQNVVKSSGNAARLTLGDVYSSAKLRRFVFVQYFIWFAVSLGSNIEVSEIPPLDENKFFRVLVRGVVEIGTLILIYFLSQR
ncbi:solute carrier family 22 member 7-like [Limulus polyphemus]|uniref:Solute carrier family 22 member 7-like n=1 Tax=Limulus polyphemus TaxID=6850 RepID=A0ABM1TC79_LIMPO|nr:solute carrier family 22 member 7-like [Limulus polyphemus]